MSKLTTPARIASSSVRNSRNDAGTFADRNSRKNEMNTAAQLARRASPSPAPREREGPAPQAWEGEGIARGNTLTRLASLATLSRIAGEGLLTEPLIILAPFGSGR